MANAEKPEKPERENEPRRRLGERSPWAAMQEEINQTPHARQRLIAQLEELWPGYTVITYFTSHESESGVITDADAETLEELLNARGPSRPVLLVIDSPGGQALAAERIVNVCRCYSGDQFEVVVPHMAKSAATMICFGARKIHMSRTSELGPVDPQIAQYSDRGGILWISADELLRAYDTLIHTASKDPNVLRVEPFLQQLQRFDARRIEQVRSVRALSRDISVKLLKAQQMTGKTPEEIQTAIKIFIEQEAMSSHGRRIGIDEARECGLKVEEIDLASEKWKLLWALYRRSSYRVSEADHIVKLMETATDAVYA